MAKNYSPKRQAIADMKKEGLDVSLIERTQIFFDGESLVVVREGCLVVL